MKVTRATPVTASMEATMINPELQTTYAVGAAHV